MNTIDRAECEYSNRKLENICIVCFTVLSQSLDEHISQLSSQEMENFSLIT